MCPMPGVEWPRLGNDRRRSAHALTRVCRFRLGPSLVIKLFFFCGGGQMLIKNVQNQPRRAAGAVTTDERKK